VLDRALRLAPQRSPARPAMVVGYLPNTTGSRCLTAVVSSGDWPGEADGTGCWGRPCIGLGTSPRIARVRHGDSVPRAGARCERARRPAIQAVPLGNMRTRVFQGRSRIPTLLERCMGMFTALGDRRSRRIAPASRRGPAGARRYEAAIGISSLRSRSRRTGCERDLRDASTHRQTPCIGEVTRALEATAGTERARHAVIPPRGNRQHGCQCRDRRATVLGRGPRLEAARNFARRVISSARSRRGAGSQP